MTRGHRNLIPFAALTTAITVTLADLEEKKRLPTVDQWISWAIVFFILSMLADIGMAAANGFAVLALVAILLSRGEAALLFANEKARPARGPRGPVGEPSSNPRTSTADRRVRA